MSAPPSKSSQPIPMTFNERLNEQLMNCLNAQTHVIQNLTLSSQHISFQLLEIKSTIEILSNRVLALQQQQIHQQPHFPPTQYASPYYSNYLSQQPLSVPPPPMPHSAMPTSHPSMPMSHPPPTSHPPSFPFSAQQPSGQVRLPITTTSASSTTLSFFPSTTINPPAPLPSNVPSFQFSTPTSHPTVTNALPTTTTPTKPLFSNLPTFTTADTNTKPPSFFPTSLASASGTGEKSTINPPFVFGTGNTTSIFGSSSLTSGLSTVAVPKPEVHADDDGEEDGEEDSYEPDGSFTGIVQLSAVEVKTGEEDENVLFCERAKLYRFDAETNQMKERGVGEMKILKHKTTNQCRILMRREQVLKLCANHKITSQMELKPHAGTANAFLWSAMDFADGEAKHETLCVRFKTDEQAKNFLKVFNEAKEINMKVSGDTSLIEKTSVKEDTNANDDDVVSIGEVKPSAEQIDRAKKLQLPSTFFLYENKEPCKGCPGCEEDTPPIVADENKPTTKKPTDTVQTDTKPTTPQPQVKTPLGSSENTKFSFMNAEKSQAELQKQSSVSKEEKPSVESSTSMNIASQYDNKPSIFGVQTNIFGSAAFGSPALSSNTTGGFTFPGFGNTTTPSNGFQFSTQPTTSAAASSPSTATFSFGAALASTGTSASKPVFGNSPKFSFADLAKQSVANNDKSTSNASEQRVFAGQGSLIFGTGSPTIASKPNNNDDDDGGDGGDADDSYEPNVSFKPIVQLSAVEVKTGEEDENVLFCERAKIYRFDAETNQMKERGVGEMKILKHKTTNQCRILMRREQVLKLCANHQITSNMELKPHQGSENAYVWSAMDFADGEAKHETLCVRFKSSDLAKKFLTQFNEAKQANATAAAAQ